MQLMLLSSSLPLILLLLNSHFTTAHYTFPALIYASVITTPWQYVRQWTGYYTYNPVTDVTNLSIRCNVDGSTAAVAAETSTLSVTAGQTLGFTVDPDIYHPGPLQAYMAKVPAGSAANNWDGSGAVWFKIFGQGPEFTSGGLVWPTNNPDATTVTFTLPASLPNGEYLFRVEHIALHSASTVNGAQFYLSCAQINVSGGGSGKPGPLVAFPGAYSPTDPGLLINIYWPIPTNYTLPGPPVWSG